MSPVLGLEEGGALPYLRARPASPLVCSEIASLARPSTSRLRGGHSLPSPRPRRTKSWQDDDLAPRGLPLQVPAGLGRPER